MDGSVLSNIADRGGYKNIKGIYGVNRGSPTDATENKQRSKQTKTKTTGTSQRISVISKNNIKFNKNKLN